MLDASRHPDPASTDPWLSAWGRDVAPVLAGIANVLQGGRLTEPVLHTTRREIKRLRALLRLAPRSVATLAEDTREVIGEVRRRLGRGRDATVMLKTLAALARDIGDAAARIEPVLAAHRRAAAGELDRRSWRADHERIAGLAATWREQRVEGSLADLRRRAVKTFRKARKRSAALGRGDAVAVHRLRKTAVDHQYHLAFFAGDKKGKLRSRHKRVHRLRDRLGECHDLDALRDFVRGRADITASDLVALEETMKTRRRRLLERSRTLAAELFADKPRRFGKRLKREVDAAPP